MKFDDWKIIAVIGAGDMGHGIAQLALMTGYEVHLCDIKYEYVQHGISRIQTSLEKLVSKGKCDVSVLENSKMANSVAIPICQKPSRTQIRSWKWCLRRSR